MAVNKVTVEVDVTSWMSVTAGLFVQNYKYEQFG
jgi:hypothetical protein